MSPDPDPPSMEVEEEVEANDVVVDDLFFPRIGAAVPLFAGDSSYDLNRPPIQPIEFSGVHRLLFLAHSQGFMVARSKDAIQLAKEVKEKGRGRCIKDVMVVNVEIGRVSILALSKDCSTLAAVVGGDITFYAVASLLNNEEKPSFSFSLSQSEIVRDFKWQKRPEESFLVLSNHGLLRHGNVSGHLQDVIDHVDAVDWSVKGDFIAIVRKGNLTILSSSPQKEKHMTLLLLERSESTDTQCHTRVDSLKWVRDDSIVIGSICFNEDDGETDYHVKVVTSRKNSIIKGSSKPVVFSFPVLFQDILDDIIPPGSGPYMLISYLERWEVALVSNKKVIDEHLQLLQWSLDEGLTDVVILRNQIEKYAPHIGRKENHDDNLVLGLVIDQFSLYEKVEVQIGVETSELSPYCIVLCLTAEGKLVMFHAARCSNSPDLNQTSVFLDNCSSVKERFPVVNAPENELTAISISKDNNEEEISSFKTTTLQDTGKFSSNIEGISASRLKDYIFTPSKNDDATIKSLPKTDYSHALNLNKLPIPLPQIHESRSESRNISQTTGLRTSLVSDGASPSSTINSTVTEPTRHATTCTFEESVEISKPNSTTTGLGASFEPQDTRKLFVTDNIDGKPSSAPFNRLVPGVVHGRVAGVENIPSNVVSDPSLSEKPFSLKSSMASSPTQVFSFNTVNQNEGSKAPLSSIHNSPFLAQEVYASGMPITGRMQQFSDIAGVYKAPYTLSSESQPQKDFYDVNDMIQELDTLLLRIEGGGGLLYSCTSLHNNSLFALEGALENLSKALRSYENKLEEKLGTVQQLQNKMLQVSTRMKYMEGIIKQASDWQYWDILDRQKLNPELEQKKQNILTINQNLTRHLIELERHFNALEFNKFGETARGPTGNRAFHDVYDPSRKMQSFQSVCNTLNSQLAAAEQLAVCLSNQMAALDIKPPSGNCENIAREILDSIGFLHDSYAVQTPVIKHSFTPSSAKYSEPETSRRRGDSLIQSLADFEPQKTTVKRTLHGQDSRVKTFHMNSQKPVIDGQKNTSISTLETGAEKLQLLFGSTSNHERPSKDFRIQSSSLLKSTKMSSSQLLAPELESLQRAQYITQPLRSSFDISQNNSRNGFDLSNMPYAPATEYKINSDAFTLKAHTSSKSASLLQLNASTSLRSNDTVTPKILLASNAVQKEVQAGGHYYHSSEKDNLARSSPGTVNLLENSSDDFNPSQNLHITMPSNCVQGTNDNIDFVNKGMSAETAPDYQATFPPYGVSCMSASPLDAFASSTTPSASLSISTTNSTSMSSLGTDPIRETCKIIPLPSVPVVASTASSVLPSFPLQKSLDSHTSPSESATSQLSPSRTADDISISIVVPSQSHSNEDVHSPSKNGSKAEHVAIGTSESEISHASLENVPNSLPNFTSNSLLDTSNFLSKPSFSLSNLSSTSVLKDEGLDNGSSQEEDMEEEASNTSTMLNLGSFSKLGFGPSPSSDIQKPNPFCASFGMTSGAPGSSLAFTSPLEIFRPASFSLPTVQPTQPSQSVGSGPFSGGPSTGFSGFGQPAQIGVGQHALGSVLGSFGQSRQLGVGAPGIGVASAGNPIPTGINSGGFSSTAFSGPGGFISQNSTGIGFAAAPTVGFAAHASSTSGFAGAATGGGFAGAAAGGGFAGAAAGGGFAALASGSGGSGFAHAASPGNGFGVGPGIGFQQGAGGLSFGINQGGFASMGRGYMDPSRPPSDLLTKMRK